MIKIEKVEQVEPRFFVDDVILHITAPLYWWREVESWTVHYGSLDYERSLISLIMEKPLKYSDFDFEGMRNTSEIVGITKNGVKCTFSVSPFEMANDLVILLNSLRKEYLETCDERALYEILHLLPSSYLQTQRYVWRDGSFREFVDYHYRKSVICGGGCCKAEWRQFHDWAYENVFNKEE